MVARWNCHWSCKLYIHICVYVCVCVCVHMYVHVYIWYWVRANRSQDGTFVGHVSRIYVCECVGVRVYVHTCIYVWMYIYYTEFARRSQTSNFCGSCQLYTYVYMWVCVWIYMQVFIRIYICISSSRETLHRVRARCRILWRHERLRSKRSPNKIFVGYVSCIHT